MDPGEPYPPIPRPAGLTITMKAFTSLISVFIIAQFIGTVLFGLYLHMKMDKRLESNPELASTVTYGHTVKTVFMEDNLTWLQEIAKERRRIPETGRIPQEIILEIRVGDEISLREDFVFLRKLQKCQKPQDGGDASLLDCEKILSSFQDLPQNQESKVEAEVPQGSLLAKQTGDKRQAASIHLAGWRDSKRVLQWKRAPYAPMDSDTFSYQDGKIKVGKRGRYYIYSQVAFCTKPEMHAPFSLSVYLNLPSEVDQLLLKGVGTHRTSDDTCSLQSIHVGRVVELQQGHVIFVNVTDSSRVNYNHGYTYFGMFELS